MNFRTRRALAWHRDTIVQLRLAIAYHERKLKELEQEKLFE